MKICPFCAEEIQDAAIVCKHCKSDLSGKAPVGAAPARPTIVRVEAPAWRPGVAAVLSLFIPGAGQIYKGQTLNGIVWLIIVVIGYAALIVPGLILHICCIVGAGTGDPYREQRERQEHETAIDERGARIGRAAAGLLRGVVRSEPSLQARPPLKIENPGVQGYVKTISFVLIAFLLVAIGIGAALPHMRNPNDATPRAADVADADRAILLRNAIVGVGDTCNEVTNVFYQGGKVGTGTYWSARCRDGNTYTIQQKPDGHVTVATCAAMAIANIKCFVPLSKQ